MTLHAVAPLACQEDARRVATDDRAATADLILSLAIHDAVDFIRAGRPGFARYRLTRALISAGRILGESRPGVA